MKILLLTVTAVGMSAGAMLPGVIRMQVPIAQPEVRFVEIQEAAHKPATEAPPESPEMIEEDCGGE